MKSVITALEAAIVLALVLVGITGVSYHTFRDDGWLSRGFVKISDFYINYPLIALAATTAAFFAFRAWRTRKIEGKRTRFHDYIIYALMALGIYFIGRYALTGQF